MRYTQKRIQETDCHIFVGDPLIGTLAPVRSYSLEHVSDIKHGWFEDKLKKVPYAKINASYFNTSTGAVVGGMYVDSGWVVSPFLDDAKFVTMIWDGSVMSLDESYDIDDLKTRYPKMKAALQLGDPLVKDSKAYKGDGYFDHTWSDAPRTFVGQLMTGEIVFFATDGRTGSDNGFTTADLRQIALDMKCKTAVMCDGGGSSTLMIEGKMVNDNENRKVPSVFLWYDDPDKSVEWINESGISEPVTYESFLATEISDGIFWKDLVNNQGNIHLNPDIWEWEGFTKSYDWLLSKFWFPNFTYSELACNDDNQIMINESVFNHGEHMQLARDEFGPMKANSWGRTGRYGRSIGSSNTSQHFLCVATDIGGNDDSWRQRLKVWWMSRHWGGVGIYNTFIHLDSRGEDAEWWG